MDRVKFQDLAEFLPAEGTYRLLPFRFIRFDDGQILLVNDVGEHAWLTNSQLRDLVGRRLQVGTALYGELTSKHFICDSDIRVPLQLLSAKYRTKKSFLSGFTSLHLFVVTLRCEHSCPYCQVSRVTADQSRYDMSRDTASRAIDLLFRSPSPYLKIEFQGGEPLLNFPLIQYIVESIRRRNEQESRSIEFVIATNLALVTDDIINWIGKNGIFLSTSLDGPRFLHNANRPRPGNNSYELLVENLDRVREALGPDSVSALMTTTRLSLRYAREIVDEYVDRSFDAIFLRPVSPFGFATRARKVSDYSTDDFLRFYQQALGHIIDLNRQGVVMCEAYAQILLRKILTPYSTGYVDLQSPAGAGISCVAFNYDGSVYPSDEARMLAETGDHSFRLGNVHTDSYEQIFGGCSLQDLVRAGCNEALVGCRECAFQPYCGADPVFNYATQGDLLGHRPTSSFCRKNMSILRLLFDVLRGEDQFTRSLFESWALANTAG